MTDKITKVELKYLDKKQTENLKVSVAVIRIVTE